MAFKFGSNADDEHMYWAKVDIEMDLKEETNELFFNAQKGCFTIKECSFSHGSDTQVQAIKTEYVGEDLEGVCCASFPQPLPAVNGARLSFLVGGPVTGDQALGIHLTKYGMPDGSRRAAIISKFEPHYARRAFPCLDEPSLKVPFQLSISHPSNRVTLSNAPVDAERDCTKEDLLLLANDASILLAEYTTTAFARTVPISTYLVAWACGDFESVEGVSPRLGMPIRCWATPGKRSQLGFSAEYSGLLVDWLSDKFQVPFTSFFPKLDSICYPDYVSGANEQWALISYRESYMLVDESTPHTSKMGALSTISHEMTHQWFGNSVSLLWWDELWLKEAMATYMGYAAANEVCKDGADSGLMSLWLSRSMSAFNVDCLRGVDMPIHLTIDKAAKIRSAYSKIAYDKGSFIISTLFDWLGVDTAFEGLAAYVKKYHLGVSTAQGFYESLSEASAAAGSPKDVAALAQGWIRQPGFPLVTIENWPPTAEGRVRLSQRRFFNDGGPSDDSLWKVPIRAFVGASDGGGETTQVRHLLETKEGELQLKEDSASAASWIKLNAGSACFYLTLYPEALLKTLCADMATLLPDPRDRMSLIFDVLSLVQASLQPPSALLLVLRSFIGGTERDNEVMRLVLAGLLLLRDTVEGDEEASQRVQSLCEQIFLPIVERVGWQRKPNESVADHPLRPFAISALGAFASSSVLKKGLELFRSHSANLELDVRAATWFMAARWGSAEDNERLRQLLLSDEQSDTAKRLLQAALASGADVSRQRSNLEWLAADRSRLRPTDCINLRYSSAAPAQKRVFWEWFKAEEAKKDGLFVGQITWPARRYVVSGACGATSEEFSSYFFANNNEKCFGVEVLYRQIHAGIKNGEKFKQENKQAIASLLKQ